MALNDLGEGEFLLGLSAGIGDTISQAEFAMLHGAKKMKNSDPLNVPTDPIDFHIVRFEDLEGKLRELGERQISDIESQRPQYEDLIKHYSEFLADCKGNTIKTKKLNKLTITDPTTGLLNRLGYYLAVEGRDQLVVPDGHKRLYVLFDCDYVKHFNYLPECGYGETTRHICAIGQGIFNSTRHQDKSSQPDQRKTDTTEMKLLDLPLATRNYGAHGDEFLLDIFCPGDQIAPITQRIIAAANQKQLELYQ